MTRFNYNRRSKNKLNAHKTEVDGIKFDSIKEARRYNELKLLERAGAISNLRLQVKYELIPPYYEEQQTGVYQRGDKAGEPKYKRVTVEQGIDYIADFVYTENGKEVVEDVKGYREPSSAPYRIFVMKRKMMLYKYGIKVKEI